MLDINQVVSRVREERQAPGAEVQRGSGSVSDRRLGSARPKPLHPETLGP
jgi:hypothetical protein